MYYDLSVIDCIGWTLEFKQNILCTIRVFEIIVGRAGCFDFIYYLRTSYGQDNNRKFYASRCKRLVSGV